MGLDLKSEFTKLHINQIDSVYKDIKKQASILESVYGFPKFSFMEENPHNCIYRGKHSEVTLLIGFSRVFNMQFELVQWIKGESIQKEFIEKGNEGFFSNSVYVVDLHSYLDEIEKLGITVLQKGIIHRTEYAYLDTKETLGVTLEFQEQFPRKQLKERLALYDF
jgi:hypothetical protein